jgi:hypothetical protein
VRLTSLVCGSASSYSSDSAVAWIANRKRAGERLSPSFTPEVDGKVAFAFPTLVDTSMSVSLLSPVSATTSQDCRIESFPQVDESNICALATIFQALKSGLDSRRGIDAYGRGHESIQIVPGDRHCRYTPSLAVMIELKGFESTSNSLTVQSGAGFWESQIAFLRKQS